MGAVDKVDQIVAHGVQARRKRFVFDATVEFDIGYSSPPCDGVPGLNIEVDEEEGGYGRRLDVIIRRQGQREGGVALGCGLVSAQGSHW